MNSRNLEDEIETKGIPSKSDTKYSKVEKGDEIVPVYLDGVHCGKDCGKNCDNDSGDDCGDDNGDSYDEDDYSDDNGNDYYDNDDSSDEEDFWFASIVSQCYILERNNEATDSGVQN